MTARGDSSYELGLIGLGVMGRNFLQNLADQGYRVLGHDKDEEKTRALREEGSGKPIGTADDVAALIRMLRPPRAVTMLVPAGSPVPSLSVSLAYFDAYRSASRPANLVQAQRDFLGAHAFARIDAKGKFHVAWSQPEPASSQSPAAATAGGTR